VNRLQDAFTSPSINSTTKLRTEDTLEISADGLPKPSPGCDSDVLEDIPPNRPVQDDEALDMSDTEDMITVYTGEL